jgi:hypothetical protein
VVLPHFLHTMMPIPSHVHRRGSARFGNCEPKRRVQRHVIANIAFVPGVPSELAPVECSCGWSGISQRYQDHRAEVGERRMWSAGNPGRELKRDRPDAA